MKGCGIRDRLNAIRIVEIIVRDGNRRAIVDLNRLRKTRPGVGIGGAAIADEPARVHEEVHQIRQAPDARGSRGRAAGQRAKFVQIHRRGPARFEIGVDKIGVTHLIQRVAGDVLRAVRIEVR